jgi:23S rRNA A2030 N6-methylase RlmJ
MLCIVMMLIGVLLLVIGIMRKQLVLAVPGGVLIFVFLLLGGIEHSARWTEQVDNQEQLVQMQEVLKISQQRASYLLVQFKQYLAHDYPNLEKSVFAAISPSTVAVYMVKYPPLKSADTIQKLVDEIKNVSQSYYNAQVEMAKIRKEMRARGRSILYVNAWLPEASDEVKKLIESSSQPTPLTLSEASL